MYSSVTSQAYSSLYYDTLMTPVRINNRVAILTSDNPFMLHLLGVRYLETSADAVPTGYKVIQQSGDTVLAENDNVLPRAYFTSDIITQDLFEKADPLGKAGYARQKDRGGFLQGECARGRPLWISPLCGRPLRVRLLLGGLPRRSGYI